MSQHADEFRGLGWRHGALTVQRHGAMLAPLTFLLADGRQVSPMHVAPWAGEPGTEALPGILQRLRGEWPCVPFGYPAGPGDGSPAEWAELMFPAAAGDEPHGHSSNHAWNWEASDSETLRLSLDYPDGSPVSRLERTITPDPEAPAVDIALTIMVREDCRLPIGLHPTFRLPTTHTARIEPAPFDHGRTYPGSVEPGRELMAPDRRFASLAAVPTRDGGTVDASQVPLRADTEELLQLNNIDGMVALANEAEGYRVRLRWQKEHFPSLLLWYSNRGRTAAPWSGRHVTLGMEPICSPFDFGPATALADNPIARSGTPTARRFAAGETFVTRYRIEAEAI
jgi:hypothetical protein